MADAPVPLSDAERQFAARLREQSIAPPTPDTRGDLRAGISSGISQLTDQAVGESAVGLGRVLGSERLERFGERRVAAGQEAMQQAAEGRVIQPTDVRSVGDAADAFQFALGQQLPRVAAVAAAGGAGAVAGRRVAGTPGAIAGGVLGAMGVNLPTLYGEARGEQREVGVDDQAAALRTGAAAATVETLSDAALFGAGRLLRAAGFSPANKLQAVLGAAAGNIPVQAATELAQEEIFLRAREAMDPEFDIGGEEATMRRINAAILGAVLGPTFAGGIAALQRGPQRTQDREPEEDAGVPLPPGQDIAPGQAAPVESGVAPAAAPEPVAGVQPVEGQPVAPEPVQDIPDSEVPIEALGLTPEPAPEPVAVSPAQLDAAQATGQPVVQPAVEPAQPSTQPLAAPVDTTSAVAPTDATGATAQITQPEPAAQPTPSTDAATPVRLPDPDTPAARAEGVEITPLDGDPITWPSPDGERRVLGTTPTGEVVVETAGQQRAVLPQAELRTAIELDLEASRAVAPQKTPERALVDGEVARVTGDEPAPTAPEVVAPEAALPSATPAPEPVPAAAPEPAPAPEPTTATPLEATPVPESVSATPAPAERIVRSDPVDASDTFEPGAQRSTYSDPESGGRLEIVQRPDGTASVIGLEVPEGSRGQGIGSALQAQAQQDNPLLQGQVSSKAAATTAYRLGRRPVGQPDATLEQVFSAIDRDSSVNMVTPEMQARLQAEAQTPEQAYNELTALDKVDPYDSAEVRPGTTSEQRAKGRSALRDLFRQLTARYQRSRGGRGAEGEISLLGAAMYKNFKAGEPNQLVGQQVTSAADLAALAQVYRDPRFETFRYVYVDDNGTVLGETAVTSRLPAVVSFGETSGSFGDVLRAGMQEYGATGYYMMHNHPSGNAQPSNADKNLTRFLVGTVPGFRGHTIVDLNEYGTISARGLARVIKDDTLNGKDFRSTPEVPHGVVGREIRSSKETAEVVKALQLGDKAAVILLRPDNTVATAASMPFDAIMQAKGSKERQRVVLAALRRMGRAGGADFRATLVLPPGKSDLKELAWMRGTFRLILDSEGRILGQTTKADSIFERQSLVTARVREPTTGVEGALPTPGITTDAVQAQVTAVTADWAAAPPINVVQSAADLPPFVSQYAQEAGIEPAGVFWNGEAYLVADNITSPEGVRTVIAHEVLGHGGLRALFGNQFQPFAQRVARDLTGNEHFDKFVKAHRYQLSDPQQAATAADEYLAHIAQRIDEGRATERMRAVWSRVVSAVNEFLRSIGLNVKLSNAEMHTLMMTARQRITGGTAELSPTMVTTANGPVEVVPPSFIAKGEAAKSALNGFTRPLATLKDTGITLRGIASDALPWVLKLTSRQDLARNFAPMFQDGPRNLLNDYVRTDREQSAFTDGKMVAADKVFREQLRALPKDQRNKVHGVMEFATLRGLRAGDPAGKQPWTAQQWEDSGNLERYGGLAKAVDDLNTQWDGLTPQAREAYVAAIRGPDSMTAIYKDIIQALEANVIDTMEPGEARDAAIRNIHQMKSMLKGDYAPLSRFGSHVIVGYKRDADGNLERAYRRHFASVTQMEMHRAKLQRDGTYDVVKPFTAAEFLEQTKGIGDVGFINDFERALKQKMLGGLDPEGDADTYNVSSDYIRSVIEITRQFYYEQQPDGSIMKHQMHREGVEGYETDFSRSYAEYMMKHARTLGNLRYGLRKGEILRDMRRYMNEMNDGEATPPPDYDGVRAGIVYNSVVERENTLRTEKTAPVVQALGKYTFLQMLTSVSQYVVQTSQVPMFWLPSIGARKGVGFGRAASEMGSALRTIATGKVGTAQIQSKDMNALTDRLFQQVTPENRDQYPNKRIWDNVLSDQELDAEISKLPQATQELLALRIMADRGVLDITRSHDLQRGASDNFGIAKTDTGHMLNRAVDTMGFIMRHSEMTNRRVSILGTLRINRQDGQGFMAALRDAEDTTLRTQFDYSRANKAPWLTNDWMKVFTQIQSFRFYSMGFMLTEFNKAFTSNKVSPAERAEARRVLGYMMVTTSMYAGAIGTPLGAALVAATNAIMGDDDEPFDAAHEADLFFRELGPAGETFSRLALQKGVPGALGVDISRRTELASVFKSSVFDAPEGVTGNRYMEWLAAQLLGPSWSNVTNLVRAGEALGEGDMVEANIRILPAAFRDWARLYDVATNGVRGGGDMMLMTPDQLKPSDYIIMAAGLQPTRLNEMREADRAILNRNTVLSQRRSKIVRQVERALEDNNDRALDEALEELYAFNEAQPVFAIGKSDILSAARGRIKKDMGIHTDRYLQIQDQYGYRHRPVEAAQ